MRYAVVIDKAESNYSAYVPDLTGCVATGATVEEVEREIRVAIAFHIEGMREDGLSVLQPSSSRRVNRGGCMKDRRLGWGTNPSLPFRKSHFAGVRELTPTGSELPLPSSLTYLPPFLPYPVLRWRMPSLS